MRRYDALCDLPLVVESLSVSRHERAVSSGFTRRTTTVELAGDGAVGRGEDVCYEPADHEPYPDPALAGEYTIDGFSATLAETDLWPEPPSAEHAPAFRRWAFESAALDLALKQADTTLAAALDVTPEPIRFVVSTRLDSFDRIERLLAANPQATFKLDPTPTWSDDLLAQLADTGRVHVLDLKGHYQGTDVDVPADLEFYERVADAFPEATLEDPAITPETRSFVARERERVAWDYPITSVEAVESLPVDPAALNVKPSRFGTLAALLDTVDYAAANGIDCYGGGQFELGVGREQAQALAAVCYPDAANDLAPPAYNDPEPTGRLPRSPLSPPVGFGRR